MKTSYPFNWSISGLNKKHCSRQIEDFIIENIKSRNLHRGDILPGYRTLAQLNGVSPNSVRRAYARLIESMWLDSELGSGTFISDRGPVREEPEELTDFKETFPIKLKPVLITPLYTAIGKNFAFVGTDFPNPSLFPEDKFAKFQHKHRIATAHLSQAELLLGYQGRYLKEAVIKNLNTHRGLDLHMSLVEIIKGREESLRKVFRVLITDQHHAVINTSLHDHLLNDILNDLGVKVYQLSPADSRFLTILEKTLKQNPVRAIYIRPQSSFPEGRTLQPWECTKLIELAKKYKACIIEEEEDHEFWLGNLPYRPMAYYRHEGYVVYLAALSKATPYMQSLRLIIASSQMLRMLDAIPLTSNESRDVIVEKAIADLINSGAMDEYRRNSRQIARKNRDILDLILRNYLSEFIEYAIPEHGLTFWLHFDERFDLNLMLKQMEEMGISVPYHPNHQPYHDKFNHMLLGFGAFDITEAEGAAKILREIMENTDSPG